MQENLNVLLRNPQENAVFKDLNALMSDFQQVFEKYQEFLQEISRRNEEKLEISEEFLNKIFNEAEFMQTVLQEYAKLSQKSINYAEFRGNFLVSDEKSENFKEKFEETKRPERDFSENSLKLSGNAVFSQKIAENSEIREGNPSNFAEIMSIESISTVKPAQTERFDAVFFENTVLSNIQSFNENRKRYLSLMKSSKNEEKY